MVRREKEREFRELVLQAFADARAKGKSNWRTMDLSVLKNRLLQRTDRRFRESDYGARTIAELVAQFPEVLALGKGRKLTVSLLVERDDGTATGEGTGEDGPANDGNAGFLGSTQEAIEAALDVAQATAAVNFGFRGARGAMQALTLKQLNARLASLEGDVTGRRARQKGKLKLVGPSLPYCEECDVEVNGLAWPVQDAG